MGKPGFPTPHRCWERLAPPGRGAVRQAHRRRFDRLTAGGSTGSPQVGKPGFPVFSPQCCAAQPHRWLMRMSGKPDFPAFLLEERGRNAMNVDLLRTLPDTETP